MLQMCPMGLELMTSPSSHYHGRRKYQLSYSSFVLVWGCDYHCTLQMEALLAEDLCFNSFTPLISVMSMMDWGLGHFP